MEQVKIYRNMAHLTHSDIFYRDTKTEAPAILCLHGRWGRGETWVDFMHHYGKDYRVIAPDQRGHGLSSKPLSTYSAEEMATDMVELLDYLQLDSVLLVGHSMGGRIAGYITARYPAYVNALVILDKSASGPANPHAVPVDHNPPGDPLTQEWPLPFATFIEAQTFLRHVTDSDLEYDYFMQSLVETVEGYQMMFSAYAMAANIAAEEAWFHLLPKLTCPVMLMRAQSTDAVSEEDFQHMQSLITDCVVHEISHPDHNVHLSHPAEFYRYIDGFLHKVYSM